MEKTAFLPFHAINEFMLDEYRRQVVLASLMALESGHVLPADLGRKLAALTKKHLSVPGFRDARKAPVRMRLQPAIKVFQKSPEFAAGILAAWAESLPELRRQVYDLLTGRGWELLPPEADRTVLPGFLTVWPAGEHFEVIAAAFREAYPQSETSDDDISLMTVWLGGRLPYEQAREADSPSGDEVPSEA
ncbi:MAG: hypothetical protein Fur0018_01540 [Anaerolineales bacterium]